MIIVILIFWLCSCLVIVNVIGVNVLMVINRMLWFKLLVGVVSIFMFLCCFKVEIFFFILFLGNCNVVGLLLMLSVLLSFLCNWVVFLGVVIWMLGMIFSIDKFYILLWLVLLLLVILVWFSIMVIGSLCSVIFIMIWLNVWFRNVE